MNSGVYGPEERARLATLADQLAAQPGAVLTAVIADTLHSALPDVDDVTIGRVLVALPAKMPQLFTGIADPVIIGQALTCAGLSMTEPEWKDQQEHP